MADADRIQLSLVSETVWGVVNSPTPTLQNLRLTSESLKQETGTEDSKEIRPDRNKSDTIRTSVQAGGDIAYELSYGSYDSLFKAALFSPAWSAIITDIAADISISFTAAGSLVTGVHNDFVNYVVGAWVLIEGSTSNNSLAKILAINSTNPGTADNDQLVVAGFVVVDEIAGQTVSITQLSYITNGTTEESFLIEKNYTDLTNTFVYYTGLEINSMSLNMSLESVITGNFAFIGKDENWGTATIGSGSNTDAPTNNVMNTVDNIQTILENYSAYEAISFNIDLQNNLRARGLLGQLAKDSIGTGLCSVTGTIQAYFESQATLDKYTNFTTTSLSFILSDSAGNKYIFDLPEVKLTTGSAVAPGQSSDIIADMSFSAMMDPTEEITLRISRMPAQTINH
jgi:hypothetical protein